MDAAELMARIGARVRELRSRGGLSLADLAADLDTSPNQMLRIERGCNARLSTLLRVAEALEADLVVEFRPRGGR